MTSLGLFSRLVCRSGRRAGQSGFTGDWFVAGFAHQGERRRRRGEGFQGVFSVVRRESRRRRGEGFQGVFSVVRRESGGRRSPTGNSSPTVLPQRPPSKKMPPRWNALQLTSILPTRIASPDAKLAAATAVRVEEAKDYSKSEAELAREVGTLERAISIIQREMSKNPAFLQKKIDARTMNNVISALTAVMPLSRVQTSRSWWLCFRADRPAMRMTASSPLQRQPP